MQAFIFVAAALALASAKTLDIRALEYGFCEGAGEPLTFETFTITPYPVVIATGATINIELIVDLMEVVPEGAKVKLDVVKKGLLDIPLPCIEVDGLHLGSCEYEGQTLLDEGAAFLCPDFFPEGQGCTLPLNPGKYGGAAPPLTIPELPDIIVDLLGSGTYEVRVHAIRPDGSEETCIFATIELSS